MRGSTRLGRLTLRTRGKTAILALMLAGLMLLAPFQVTASHAGYAGPVSTWWNGEGVTTTDECGELGGDTWPPFVFQGGSDRQLTSSFMDLRDGASIRFWVQAPVGAPPCEEADLNEDLVLQFSTDWGYTWTNVTTFSPALHRVPTEETVNLPAGAHTDNVLLRLRQTSHDGHGFDVWLVSSIVVQPHHINPLVVHDDFENGIIDPTHWVNSSGGIATTECIAPQGSGTISFPAGGVLESRLLPSLESDPQQENAYHVRFVTMNAVYTTWQWDPHPVCPVRPGEWDSFTLEVEWSMDQGVSWEWARTFYSQEGWHEVALPLAATSVRFVGSGPYVLDEIWIGPAPSHASGSTSNLEMQASSAYAFAADVLAVEFEYDSDIHACNLGRVCPAPSEWRIILDGPQTNGSYSFLPEGDVLSKGREFHHGQGGTLRHVVRELVTLDGIAPGDHDLAVAVRAPEGGTSPWEVKVASIRILERADQDGDSLPDALEEEVCIRDGVKQVFQALYGMAGHCVSDTDFVLPNPQFEHRVYVPEHVQNGADVDNDGVPRDITVHGHYIVIGNGEPNVRVEPAEPVRVMLDYWDDDANLPLLSYYCAPVDVPMSVLPDGDADGDGVPDYVVVNRATVCVDRRGTSTVDFRPSAKSFTWKLDPDSNDPYNPVPAIPPPPHVEVDTGDKLFIVKVSEDADDDGIVAYYHYEHWRVRYNHTEGSLRIEQSTSNQVKVDEDDNDPDKPLSIPLRRDEDKDHVPDSAEPVICQYDDPRTDLDGSCTIGGNYTPHPLYQLVMKTVWGSF